MRPQGRRAKDRGCTSRPVTTDPERVSQLQSGISFCHAESSALGQQNKEVREKAPLCLGLNARPAREEGFPRARAEAGASQACLLSPGQGPKWALLFFCTPTVPDTALQTHTGSYLPELGTGIRFTLK